MSLFYLYHISVTKTLQFHHLWMVVRRNDFSQETKPNHLSENNKNYQKSPRALKCSKMRLFGEPKHIACAMGPSSVGYDNNMSSHYPGPHFGRQQSTDFDKMARNGPKTAQNGFKMTQNGSKTTVYRRWGGGI